MKNFAIVRSMDAPEHVSPEELYAYAERVISRIKSGPFMPPILVMHVSESVAAVVGVESTGVIRHNRSPVVAGLSSYYEIWLVGEAGIGDYVLALQGILDDFQDRGLISGSPLPA